ncbi:hypothetical protein NE237_025069 [Protea cynaroides]|uniref:Uncharacterized protein n=1 Tax=Protea cynaroides TaxID=273540 RepID=A0A9Q0H1R0_9MAGN|nr:hypothetical protein NE237_025069 [Protea cynaroides]
MSALPRANEMAEGEQSFWKLWVWVGCCGEQEMGERELSFGKLWVWMGWKAVVPFSFRLCLPSPPMPRVFHCSSLSSLFLFLFFSQDLDETALERSRILYFLFLIRVDYNSTTHSKFGAPEILCFCFKVSYIRLVAKAGDNRMLDVA